MKVNRLEDARPYVAPNHFDMRSLRLQGFEPCPLYTSDAADEREV